MEAEASAEGQVRELARLHGQIAELERDVATAANLRSFAAETEREIAALQRELVDVRTELTRTALERERLESELRGAREVSPGNQRDAKPSFDPEVTALVDSATYASMIARSTELEHKLADAQARLRLAASANPATSGHDEPPRAASPPIGALVEHVTTLEESIAALRANMRAASDETAMMDPSESVNTISSAVSEAVEHVEIARAAIRALAATMGIT